jgi:hypothetical protein
MAALGRPVGDHRAFLIGEAQRLADAVQVIVEVIDPEADVIVVAGADRLLHAQEPRAVADAEVGIGLRHRPALDIVAVEQPVRGPAPQHIDQLPGEVVRVLHAGVQAEAAGRREAVGRIADQEDALLAERRGDLPTHAPDRAVEQSHLEVGHADMGADHLDRLRVGPWPRPLVLLVADLDDAEPAVAAVGVEDAGTRHARRLRVDLVTGGLAGEREARQVGAPVFVE